MDTRVSGYLRIKELQRLWAEAGLTEQLFPIAESMTAFGGRQLLANRWDNTAQAPTRP